MSVKSRTDNTPTSPDSEYLENLERLNQQANGNALLRIWQIVGDKKRGIPALIPVGRSSFWRGVKEGRYPPCVRLGKGTTAWYYRDIVAVIMNAGATKTTEGGGNE